MVGGIVDVGADVVVGAFVVGVVVFEDDECKMRTKITTNEITQHIPQQIRKRDSAVLLFLFFFFCLKSSLGFDEDGATSDSLSIFCVCVKTKRQVLKLAHLICIMGRFI